MTETGRPLIIGLGNEMRGDDAAGLMVADLLARSDGDALDVARCDEPISLLELWSDRESAVVVDAVAGTEPGRIWRLEPGDPALPRVFGGQTSTHLLGLAEVIELAGPLGRIPARLTVIGIEGARFGLGVRPSLAVEGAVADVAASIAADHRDRLPQSTEARG